MEEENQQQQQQQPPRPIFKKKNVKSSISKPLSTEITEAVKDHEDGIDKEKKPIEQLPKTVFKSRECGISFSNEAPIEVNKKEKVKEKTIIVASALKSNFSSQIDYGIGMNIQHEKIMENYVNAKLGIVQNEEK
jgi:hypothetical protein